MQRCHQLNKGVVVFLFTSFIGGCQLSQSELIEHCRAELAAFKCPTRVEFGPLPMTSTGKVQKYRLRRTAVDFAQRLAGGRVGQPFTATGAGAGASDGTEAGSSPSGVPPSADVKVDVPALQLPLASKL